MAIWIASCFLQRLVADRIFHHDSSLWASSSNPCLIHQKWFCTSLVTLCNNEASVVRVVCVKRDTIHVTTEFYCHPSFCIAHSIIWIVQGLLKCSASQFSHWELVESCRSDTPVKRGFLVWQGKFLSFLCLIISSELYWLSLFAL